MPPAGYFCQPATKVTKNASWLTSAPVVLRGEAEPILIKQLLI